MFSLTTAARNCEGTRRREFLKIGGLSLFGLSLPKVLEAEARAATNASSGAARRGKPRDMNCILLWTDGGMSNIDTFDMKPEAPLEYRGEFQPIDTNIPGVTVCEHLPHMAQRLDKLCQVRTIVHNGGQHAEACHFMLTGYPQVPDVSAQPVGSTIYPMFGSVVGREKGWRNGLPPNVQFTAGGIKYGGAGYMGSAYNPLLVKADPSAKDFQVQDVSIPAAVGAERTMRRRSMLDKLDAWQRRAEAGGAAFDRNVFYRQAYDLITSPAAKEAFRIDAEKQSLRDRYGMHREGQSTLLARRLVEAGVRFVTVEFNGYDTHDNNFIELKDPLLPRLDQAWSALLDDLEQRGLLETTLVICAGEFGRTPKVNGAAGRDHYPGANVVCFSGGGTAMGSIVGKTDAKCERPVGQTNTTLDYAATIFRLLGIDDTKEYHALDGRPIAINNGGTPIAGVIA
ncbi:MAG: DUF1501 domain-containing protein [Planctomycetaceae bacterium]|nr:DUF1501 domain-containing protein [Planctomycetaceae bacterium]